MEKMFPNEELISTKHFNVHQDWEVPIPGFFILETPRKIRSISEFTDEESKEFMDLVRKIRKGMQEALGIKDVYFFQNEDTEHGFHLWVFPRLDWMEKFGRKIQSVRPIINYAKENMVSEGVKNQVKLYVNKMKSYLSNLEQNGTR